MRDTGPFLNAFITRGQNMKLLTFKDETILHRNVLNVTKFAEGMLIENGSMGAIYLISF